MMRACVSVCTNECVYFGVVVRWSACVHERPCV